MRIGVLGTGPVGQTIATKLIGLGHEVCMGSRRAGNERAAEWVRSAGPGASEGDFARAARHGELVVNCTAGAASLGALHAAGVENLSDKVLVDLANPLEAAASGLPRLSVCNDDSLGEQIQAAFPGARVVKTLNTVNAGVMVDPDRVPGEHVVFVSGNDRGAKDEVADLLSSFGWAAHRIIDLGDITTARGPEMYLSLWLRMMGALDTAEFNISVSRT
jgi:8-hydroxy-5-deazaflavin:NADPH oxidoreductase